jgi:Bifunctional DNA primase/polymerase, N-terminal
MANAILEAALDYAKHGVPVFPVNPLDKHPLCEHGFKDATTNASQIETWWQHNPNAMIGIPTGEASGYWVLDADVDPVKGLDGLAELEKLQAQNGALPETVTSITPRGGKHFYFRWSPGIRNKKEPRAMAAVTAVATIRSAPSPGRRVRSKMNAILSPMPRPVHAMIN